MRRLTPIHLTLAFTGLLLTGCNPLASDTTSKVEVQFAPGLPPDAFVKPPVAADGTLVTNRNTVASATLVATDPLKLPLKYSVKTQGAKGVVVITDPLTGAYTYTPANNQVGTDSFTFIATNVKFDSKPAITNVTINNTSTPFTNSWPFDFGTDASYAFDASKIDFTSGVCRLTGTNQTDQSNALSGFGSGTLKGTIWDSTNAWIRLSQTGAPNNNAELDSSWTPHYSNLIAYWKMNNDWVDSVGGHNGTALSGATFSSSSKLGAAAGSFAGGSDEADVTGTYLDGATAFSISAWVNVSDFSGWNGIFGSDASGPISHFQFTPSPPNLSFYAYASTGGGVQGTTDVSSFQNKWLHVAATYDGTNVRIYVNGVLDGSSTASGPLTAIGTNHLHIARTYDTSANRFLKGKIDDLAIWGVGLTAGEIATIYSRQSAKYSGTLTSRVMDALAPAMSWTKLSWIPTLPFFKALPDYSGSIQNETSADYSALVGSTGAVGDNNLMSGIVGLWHFDETSAGTAPGGKDFSDQSGAGNHAIKSASVTLGSSGKLGSAIALPGASFATTADSPSLNFTTGYSVSLWAKRTPSNPWNVLVAKEIWNNSQGWLLLNNSTSGNLVLSQGGSVTSISSPDGIFTPNQWHHIAVSNNNGNATIFLDGVAVVSGTVNISNAANSLLIGARHANDGTSGATDYFTGSIDEVSIWNRPLHSSEVLQLYRRGANRIKYQVRTCTASDCSDDLPGAHWKGTDGTNQTYFSELNNTTAPLGGGAVKRTLPSLLFSDFTSPVGPSRYFQYRTILESDDSSTNCNYGAGPTWCSPELKSVKVDPVHYDSTSPTVVGKNGVSYYTLANLAETLGASCSSGIGYNLGVGTVYSNALWYWWDATANTGAGGWAISDGTVAKSNPATVIAAHSGTFGTQVGTGTVYFKAFLKSSGSTACELDNLQLDGTR